MNAPADRRGSVPALKCRRMERRFGGLVALTGVDLRIERGEIFGLVGPNGSGNPVFAAVAHPSGQTYPIPGAAATLRPGERLQPPRAPRLGEHTDAVLAELLGLSDGQIGRLHDQGRIAGPPPS